MLEDGTYDAIVLDADRDDSDGERATSVELTILGGARKGEVVSLRTTGWHGEPLDLLGVPATITVSGGEPSVRFEP